MHKPTDIIKRDLIFYRKQLILLGAAFALTSAIVGGALFLGSSLKHTLAQQLKNQLGDIKRSTLPSNVFYKTNLVSEAVTAISYINSFASHDPDMCHASLIGTNPDFFKYWDTSSTVSLTVNNVLVNQALADELKLQPADSFVIRFQLPPEIPGDSPFSNNKNNYISLKVVVKDIISAQHGGNFSLFSNQKTPFNIFINKEYLNSILKQPGKANCFLTLDNSTNNHQMLNYEIFLNDLGLNLDFIEETSEYILTSDQYIIPTPVISAITNNFNAFPVINYLASDIIKGNTTSSYAFVSGSRYSPSGLILNNYDISLTDTLAQQIGAKQNDQITIKWLMLNNSYHWQERSGLFTVKEIIPIEKVPQELDLTVNIPGIGNAANCLEWQTDFPVDMKKIADSDKEYWRKHKGIPKAFISYDTARAIWQNEVGNASAILGRFNAINSNKTKNNSRQTDITKTILRNAPPIQFVPIYETARQSLENTTDFSQLFAGLSFILIGSAVFFAMTMLSEYIYKRKKDIGTLLSIGYGLKLIQRIMFKEIVIILFTGVTVGTIAAVFYCRLLILGVSHIWTGTFAGSAIVFNVSAAAVIQTLIISIIPLLIPTVLIITKHTNSSPNKLLDIKPSPPVSRNYLLLIICSTIIAAIIMLLLSDTSGNSEVYSFGAGILILTGLLLIIYYVIFQKNFMKKFTSEDLGMRNIFLNPARTVRYVSSIAFATFLVLSIGGYKTVLDISDSANSANAGYDIIMKTSIPVTEDLNSTDVQKEMGIDIHNWYFLPIKTEQRSSADCSNVYNVKLPTIYGVPVHPLAKQNAFSFTKLIEPYSSSPWELLNADLGSDIIPAFADQNVLQWSIKLKLGDELKTSDGKYRVRFIGALDRTIFQGGIVISSENFQKINRFNQGFTTFFIKTDSNTEANIKLMKQKFYRYGPEIQTTKTYLRKMASTQDSYLAMFMALGIIALIIGLLGTNIIFLKNIENNKKTIIFLKEIGFDHTLIELIISRENLFILVAGITTGSAGAAVALIHNLSGISWITFIITYISLTALAFFIHLIICKHASQSLVCNS